MRTIDYRFVICNSTYFNKQGGSYNNTDRILIGIKDEKFDVVYPHPISDFIYLKYHRKSGSINTESSAAKIIVEFLNFVFENCDISGIADLTIKHVNKYLTYCVSEKVNLMKTLEKKEMYLTTFFRYMDDIGVLKIKPDFIKSNYYYGNQEKTSYRLEFTYKKTDETFLRRRVKRKDMVPQRHQSNAERKIIRLNYTREFLLVALVAAEEIAFGVALQFYGGVRKGELVNLNQLSIRTSEGAKYGQRGMVLLIRDRQSELFPHKKSRTEEQVKTPRDQSVLIDPILCLLYENHINKVLKNVKNVGIGNALFYDRDGNPMSSSTYYKRFVELQKTYEGILLATKGRFNDYLEFIETTWSSHIGRGAFTNMCLDVGFTARQTAILRGDKSVSSMESYKDQISATYNITRALGLLEPGNIEGMYQLDLPVYKKYWNEVEKFGKAIEIE